MGFSFYGTVMNFYFKINVRFKTDKLGFIKLKYNFICIYFMTKIVWIIYSFDILKSSIVKHRHPLNLCQRSTINILIIIVVINILLIYYSGSQIMG